MTWPIPILGFGPDASERHWRSDALRRSKVVRQGYDGRQLKPRKSYPAHSITAYIAPRRRALPKRRENEEHPENRDPSQSELDAR
eukprot:gene26287-28756_t